MANKRFYQFLFSKQPKLTLITGGVIFGASGAVSSSNGAGVYSVTKLSTGTYQIKLVDNYAQFLSFDASLKAGVSGAAVTAGSFVSGTTYQITSLGNTNWAAIGADADYTAAVGLPFVATGVGSGTGTATAITPSGIVAVETLRQSSTTINNLNGAQGKGVSVFIQTVDAADAVANPASGSELNFKIWFKDSSVLAF